MIGGVAASAAVRTWPFRVFSFPSVPEITTLTGVRFIRAFDPMQAILITRWDMCAGFSVLDEFARMNVCQESFKVLSINPLRIERGIS